jgi:glycosyltransferase involved in cell wall biosynthesis
MKVGIDISAIVYGTGVSNYTQELVDHLCHLLNNDLIQFGFSLRRHKTGFVPLPPTLMHYLWNKLHVVNVETFTGKIDIYHSSDWAQGPSRAKKVTTIHDLSPFLYPAELDPRIVEVHTAKMKWAVKECEAFICVSQSTASDLRRLFNVHPDKIHVIYEALPGKYMSKPQITKYTNYVMAIGARQPRKNIDRLKKACEISGQKLIIVGEGSDLGYVTDQDYVNLLAGASAFVYPSLYEGFGLPILEAFYHRVPVACSNTSSFPEVAGQAAVYFDPFNIDQMAKTIGEAITNKGKLVEEGTKQLAKFSWDKSAQQTLAIYRSLLPK